LWIAEAGLRALICIDKNGNEVRRLEGSEEYPFYFPNDLCFGPNGLLYMTDSGMRVEDFLNGQEFYDGYRNFDWDGRVYEIDLSDEDPTRNCIARSCLQTGSRLALITCFMRMPLLQAKFIAMMCSGRTNQSETCSAMYCNLSRVMTSVAEMAWRSGADERLYCTVYGQQNVTVLDRNGQVADRLILDGPNPTNCAFMLSGHKLRVTESWKRAGRRT